MKIIWFSYIFIAGVATGFLVLPQIDEALISGYGFTHESFIRTLNIILYTSIPIAIIGFVLRKGKLVSYTVLLISGFSIGITKYMKSATTTYPDHITKFIDLNPRVEYMIRGISSEPDERASDIRIALKPYYIEKYIVDGFVMDRSIPYVRIESYVIDVVDGDTFLIASSKELTDRLIENAKPEIKNRRNEIYAKGLLSIRLIGVNTPEVGRYGRVSEPGGIEAKEYLTGLIKNKKVILYFDKNEPFDVYLRPLAVVFDDSEKNMINELMFNYVYKSKGVEGKKATQLYLFSEKLLKPKRSFVFKKELSENTGSVFVKILPQTGEIYQKISYGSHIEVYGRLVSLRHQTNPAGFDFAKHLRARGVYAQLGVAGISSPDQIKLIEGYKNISPWDYFVKIAAYTRVKVLQTIRETVPYPYSAFLGGVTLGLRGGVPQWVRQEFQETGVAHVLAVSGLHVGFVHILLYMIVTAFRIPKRIGYFIIVLGLLIFTLITGASPATQRAALMSSIGQFFYTFGRLSVRKSSVLTIPLAAFIILFLNPMWLPHPSFILSFMAVWSLVYISYPVKILFEKFINGWAFILFFLWAAFYIYALTTGMNIFSQKLYLSSVFSIVAGGVVNRFIPLNGFSMKIFPSWFSNFFYAQLAIQIGMMFPLSAVYFYKFPVSGMLANFIAIPLIGFIVQFGLLAGLIDMFFSGIGFSSIGDSISLLIGAFNTQLSKLFLNMAHFFAVHFPYPNMKMPTLSELAVYYLIVSVFIWFHRIKFYIDYYYFRFGSIARVLGYGFIILIAFAGFIYKTEPVSRFAVLDAGFGNINLIHNKKGECYIIDTGKILEGSWGPGPNIFTPVLSKYKIKNIKAVIITSLSPKTLGGVNYLIDTYRVSEVYLPVNRKMIEEPPQYDDFVNVTGLGSKYLKEVALTYEEFLKIIKKKNITKIKTLDEFSGVNEEFSVKRIKDDIFEIEFYGEKILYGGQSSAKTLNEIIKSTYSVFIANRNGDPQEVVEGSFKYVVIPYGYLPIRERLQSWFREGAMEMLKTHYSNSNVYITSLDGAFIVEKNRKKTIKTVLKSSTIEVETAETSIF